MQNKNVPAGYIVLALLLLISLAVNGFQAINNQKLKGMFLSLLPGESVPVLDLITLKNEPFDESIFKENKIVLLYIFESPCSTCNNNLENWRNLTQYFAKNVQAVGVIHDGDIETFKTFSGDKANFKLYSPGDIPTFRRKMRLKTRFAQTVLIHKGKVVDVKIGDLVAKDVNYLRNTISSILDDKY